MAAIIVLGYFAACTHIQYLIKLLYGDISLYKIDFDKSIAIEFTLLD